MSLEIRGFRAFGTEARVMQLDTPLVVVHAGNSQGKTSLAEGFEFLLSGRSSRRDLLGGAKAEYNDSLRNAHLPATDTDVYVEAVLRGPDGQTHKIRRELLCDFGQGTECESRLLLDGVEVTDLEEIGLTLADPPVRAPVLLQHTLRHVLSTEPKQRVGYFKALLSLTDLDQFRERVRAARGRVDSEQPGASLRLVDALSGTPAAAAGSTITALIKKPLTVDAARTAIERALLSAGAAVLADPAGSGNTPTFETVDALDIAIKAALEAQHEQSFPLSAFAVVPLSGDTPSTPNMTAYSNALTESDEHDARVTPVLQAVLGIATYAALDQPVQCPVCGTQHALTPERIAILRGHLHRTQALGEAAKSAATALSGARHSLDQLSNGVARAVPSVASWTDDQWAKATNALSDLGVDIAVMTDARGHASQVATAAGTLVAAVGLARGSLEQAGDAVASRNTLSDDLPDRYRQIVTAVGGLRTATEVYGRCASALRSAVEVAARDRITVGGLTEVSDLLAHRADVVVDVVAEAARQRTIKRLNAAEKELREAAGAVLDARFAQMSDTITKWWATIRPEELVGFGGIKRRAGGALFVNLVAALRADHASEPIEREALGVYSDSQLNALGLSIFLARTELLGAPILVLDDPIPGSDADHRLTFVQNTVGQLLNKGIQVIITTFDSKLAEWAQTNHGGSGYIAYNLDLIDIIAGTEPTQTSDVFGQLMLEAEESLYAPTAKGRRSACNTMRSAAERLAKQVIATGQTDAGTPTSVADVETKASTLGELIPLVLPFVVNDNEEKGLWKTFPKVLNPGSHDDDVPSTTDLKVVRGNLLKIAKTHNKYWPEGLLR
ncbi:AAA family ATPase [[Mycobacterium] fortunisiensis]|uniref:AAA family ATPase n=1 Tax=[Mycobacterium] fortunisiensis TaxID=2600579 RepID=UPI0027E1CD9D|nr:AAA family ATPase [[Mycobacterium] fortunisiensis]